MNRLNWSTIRYLTVSPKLLKWRVEHPEPETPSLRLGRAIHCAILEPEKFAKTWLVPNVCGAPKKDKSKCENPGTKLHQGWWYCGVHIKSYCEPGHEDDIPEGIEPMTAEDAEIVRACAENVRSHAVAKRILSAGQPEQEIEWQDEKTGILCRGRVDYLRTAKSVVDLKSTRQETPRGFVRDAAMNAYHAQVAFYHDGSIRAGRLPADAERPYIVAVENADPFDCAVYQLDNADLEAGRIFYRDLLTKYAECQAANHWPGHSPDLRTLSLPPWAPGMMGSTEPIGKEW